MAGIEDTLIPHLPILIEGNAEFASCQCATGTGTAGDPYVIENYDIDASAQPGIHIRNTQVYFVIRNIAIHNAIMIPIPGPIRAAIVFEALRNGAVENVTVTNGEYGLWISASTSTNLRQSNIRNNTVGVNLLGGSDLAVSENKVMNNTRHGVSLSSTSRSVFFNNTVSYNGRPMSIPGSDGVGFMLSGNSDNNLFEKNTLAGNTWFGFRSVGTTANTYKENTITGSHVGIVLNDNTRDSLVTGNTAASSDYGIGIEGLNSANYNNTVTGNRAVGNRLTGIYIHNSTQSLIYNNFLQNQANAYDNSPGNRWNATRTIGTNILCGPYIGGNYYSDYQGTDGDLDGIGDTAYGIPDRGSQDLLPLVQPVSQTVCDVAITSLTAEPNSGPVGGTVQITVGYSNPGTVTVSFDVTVFYNQTVIEARHVASLPASSQGALTVSWRTVAVPVGSYLIRAVASGVLGETNTSNNEFLLPDFAVLPNDAPIARFTYSPPYPLVGAIVAFDALTSTDDVSIASYLWFIGDGTILTGPLPTHVYISAGTFTVMLTVTDEQGATGSTTNTLTVRPGHPGRPGSFEVYATPGLVLLTWLPPENNGGSGITGYKVYRGESPEQITLLVSIENTTSYVDNSVAFGKKYYYYVVAFNGNPDAPGDPSETRNVLVPFSNTPGTPILPASLLAWAVPAAVALSVAATLVLVKQRRRSSADS